MNEWLGLSRLSVRTLAAGSQACPTAAAPSMGAVHCLQILIRWSPSHRPGGATAMPAVRHPVIPEALPRPHTSGLPLIAR